jgi:hypothetical protein
MPAAQPSTPSARAGAEHKHTYGKWYQPNCKACRAEDAARSGVDKSGFSDAELTQITFLIPEEEYDGLVCRAYLAKKYPEAPWVGSQLDLATLNGWPDGDKIVVLRRVPGVDGLGPRYKRTKDAEDKWVTEEVKPSAYVHEVVESAPIEVRSSLVVQRADRFTQSKTDVNPLVDRLAEVMFPCRPAMPRHKDNTVMRMVRGS